jgi:hypothetical protein
MRAFGAERLGDVGDLQDAVGQVELGGGEAGR